LHQQIGISFGISDRSARVKQLGYEARPARLVRCSAAAAGIAMKVLVKKSVIAKMRVVLQPAIVPEDWAESTFADEKQARQAVSQLKGHVINSQEAPRIRRAFDFEVVPV
jgi:hypothetical protein